MAHAMTVGPPLTMPFMDGHAADSETLLMLYALVRYVRPALIVEAGTYRGHAACVMGAALRDGKIDGEVWSADVVDYGAAKSVEQNGLQDFVHIYHGDFGAMLEGPLKNRLWRMAFVDSGITVDQSQDTTPPDVRSGHVALAKSRLASGGLLIVDDMAGDWTGVEALRHDAAIYLSQGRGIVLDQSR